MRMEVGRSLRLYFRSCALCGKWFGKTDFLCRSCEKLIRSRCCQTTGFSQEFGYPHYYALAWDQKTDFLLRPLIYALKGYDVAAQGPREVFLQMARFIFVKRSQYGSLLPEKGLLRIIFVPGQKKAGHSFYLAKALEAFLYPKALVCDVFEVLAPTDSVQKSKKKSERRVKRFHLKKSQSPFLENDKVILVDDVLTTGATARGVFERLGCPKDFEVWTLAKRMRFSQFLI